MSHPRCQFALSADEVKKTKPDPEPYLIGKSRLCDSLGWEETAMEGAHFLAIEDSVPGVVSAKRAGMTTILWAQTPGKSCPEADYVAYTSEDPLRICREITARSYSRHEPAPKNKSAIQGTSR